MTIENTSPRPVCILAITSAEGAVDTFLVLFPNGTILRIIGMRPTYIKTLESPPWWAFWRAPSETGWHIVNGETAYYLRAVKCQT